MIVSSTMENGKLPAYKRVQMATGIEKIGAELIADLSNERDGVALPTIWNNIIWLKSYMSSPRSAFASIEVSDLDGVTVASDEANRLTAPRLACREAGRGTGRSLAC